MKNAGAAAWNLRIRSTDTGRATAYVRKHQFDIGVPVQFDEQYAQVTALEYLLAAIGADLINGFQIIAHKRRLNVDNVEAVVSGELNNSLIHLGVVGEEGHPGIERVNVRVYVGTDEAEERVRQVWEEMLDKSPLVHTFRASINLNLDISIVI